MARPMAAGVFGMAPTIAVRGGREFSRNPMVGPAIMDRTNVDLSMYPERDCRASDAFCGFTAITTAAATVALIFGLIRRPRRARDLSTLPGCGSMTTTCLALRLREQHKGGPPLL